MANLTKVINIGSVVGTRNKYTLNRNEKTLSIEDNAGGCVCLSLDTLNMFLAEVEEAKHSFDLAFEPIALNI